MDSTSRVRDRDMVPSRALITGENTTVDSPKAEAPRPEGEGQSAGEKSGEKKRPHRRRWRGRPRGGDKGPKPEN